jgi:hypothetical protein
MLKPTAGEGYTFNLSTNGCRIESDSTVEVGSYLAIHVRLTDHTGSSLSIPVARVRWVGAQAFGIEFMKRQEQDGRRLEQFVRETAAEGTGRGHS